MAGAKGGPSTGRVLTSEVTAPGSEHRAQSLQQWPQAHQGKEPNPESIWEGWGNLLSSNREWGQGQGSIQPGDKVPTVCPRDWIRARTAEQHSQHSRDQGLRPELRWGS